MGLKEGKFQKTILLVFFAMPMLLASTHQQSRLRLPMLKSEIQTIQKTIQVIEQRKQEIQVEISNLEGKVLSGHQIIYLTDGIFNISNEEAINLTKELNVLNEKRKNAVAQYEVILLEEYKNRDYRSKLYFLASSHNFSELVNRLSHLSKLKSLREKQLKLLESKRQEVQKKLAVFNGNIDDKAVLSEKQISTLQKLNDVLQEKHHAVKSLEKEQNILKLELVDKKHRLARIKKDDKSTSSDAKAIKHELIWPIEKGVVTEEFGIHKHDVERKVQVENNGVDILVTANERVHSIAKGTVKAIVNVPGLHSSIIIDHGKYRAVYSNLYAVEVEIGDEVLGGATIATVAPDKTGSYRLHFEMWEGLQKRNPEDLITIHL